MQALGGIRRAVLPCEFAIPQPERAPLSYERINVRLGGTGEDVPYVATAQRCDEALGGWYYKGDSASGQPKRMVLCDADLQSVQGVARRRRRRPVRLPDDGAAAAVTAAFFLRRGPESGRTRAGRAARFRVYSPGPMPPSGPFDLWNRRLAAYGYLAPLVAGRRVLELGCGDGTGAARLLALGAAGVVAADDDAAAVSRARDEQQTPGLAFFAGIELRSLETAGPYDLDRAARGGGRAGAARAFGPATLKRLLAPEGQLVLIAPNGDRPGAAGGVGFYDLADALEPLFSRVRMFGVTPFSAFGVAEFEESAPGLRIDAGLVDEANEQPTHYIALGGPDDPIELGYALVQFPFRPPPSRRRWPQSRARPLRALTTRARSPSCDGAWPRRRARSMGPCASRARTPRRSRSYARVCAAGPRRGPSSTLRSPACVAR